MLKPTYTIPDLPLKQDLETKAVLKACATAHRHLAEMKGVARTIPNPGILIDTLALQEAKASSEIENIVTTQDELFQAELFPEGPNSPAAKEVARYRDALRCGYDALKQTGGLITSNTIVEMFKVLKRSESGFRQTPGTKLMNDATGEIVYVPPQDASRIIEHMSTLEKFINDDSLSDLDPLVKMAVIHHQFESIHPFPDGNGRIGRILNVLYLTKAELLDAPILYMSRHINSDKAEYYARLQGVRESGAWEPWVLYMLQVVTTTSLSTRLLIEKIRTLISGHKKEIRSKYPFYSQDLLNTLFRHPYTRIDFLVRDLKISRQTASKYLDQLTDGGILKKYKHGKFNYYVNVSLVNLLLETS